MAGKPRIKIDYDKIYYSNSSGPFIIIKELGRDERSRFYLRIKFLNTGTEKDIRYDIAMAGKVIDDMDNINFSKIYSSIYYGPYRIISYIGRDHESKKLVRIKFLNTGYEYNVYLKQAISGNVKDNTISYNDRRTPYLENNIEYNRIIKTILYQRWNEMMDRCYNENNKGFKKYGAIGISVSKEWHNFQNYLNDMPNIKNFNRFYYNPDYYNLDKDYLQQNIPRSKRIYSFSTCIFLSIIDNTNLSIREKYKGPYGIKFLNDGNYAVKININGSIKLFGVYNNLNAALNEYNYFYSRYVHYELVPLLNHIDYPLDHKEAQQFLVKS